MSKIRPALFYIFPPIHPQQLFLLYGLVVLCFLICALSGFSATQAVHLFGVASIIILVLGFSDSDQGGWKWANNWGGTLFACSVIEIAMLGTDMFSEKSVGEMWDGAFSVETSRYLLVIGVSLASISLFGWISTLLPNQADN